MFSLDTSSRLPESANSGRGAGQTPTAANTLQFCPQCQKGFRHTDFVNHLFGSKECMRKYWEEEEKSHSHRLRRKGKRLKKALGFGSDDEAKPYPGTSIPR